MAATQLKLGSYCPPLLPPAPNPARSIPAPTLRLPSLRRLPPLAVRSAFSEAARYTESVGLPSQPAPPTLHLTHRHLLVLNVVASAVAVSAAWLFFSAIPAVLAFKRAAESMEKLMDVTREELPATMAAVRLSGMEISDLTMELSDLGQEISQGVRGSTRAVRAAEEKLRQFTAMSPAASLQRVEIPRTETRGEPEVARAARGMKEGIVKGLALLQMFFTLTRFSRMTLNFFAKKTAK